MPASDSEIVVIDGVRYRREDAEALGLTTETGGTDDKSGTEDKAAKKPSNKARTSPSNKHRKG